MNKIFKRVISLLLSYILIISMSSYPVFAVSQDDLLTKLQTQTAEDIIKTYFNDFNKDGKYELIALTGELIPENEYYPSFLNNGIIWLVSEDNIQSVKTNNIGFGILIDGDYKPQYFYQNNKIYLVLYHMAGNGQMASTIVSINNNKITQDYIYGLIQKSGDSFIVYNDTYDSIIEKDDLDNGYYFGTGRSYKPYWYYYDENTGTIKEYGAITITKEQFLKFEGAQQILNLITEGEVYNILYRANGIININVIQNNEGLCDCSNLTVGYDNTNVWLIKNDFGNFNNGFYLNALEPDIATYTIFESPSYYEYDQTDTDENLTIPTVNDVTTETEAVNKVQTAVNQATEEQKQSATGIDKLTLLAEEASAKANTVKLTDSNVSITAENISESTALQSTTNVLTAANIQMQRIARNIVNYDLGDTETVNVKTENVSNKVDAVRISTSYASATVNANTISDFTMTNKGEKTVEINFNKDTDTTVTISFPNMNENDKYYAVVDENGNPVGGKYNPATGTLEAKLTESGIYKVVNNEKDFSDIKDKSAEMQEAIKVLASKGIINGTTATTFAPDSTISRAEVTALLMRTISLLDPNANGNFADVNTSNWYCGAAGSAKEHNIINGYEDNTFRGNTVIAKDQIVAVSARTLKQQMNYKTPSDIAGELSVYADANSIANWAKEDVALATMTNLVLKRTDSTFSGTDGMTRGDAAIIMQRLFNKLW